MMVVKKAGIGDAADIVVLDQIKNMISTVGGALATGGGILISRRYGAKDIDGAKRCANTLFSLALIITGITFIFIPIGKPFLLLLQTDSTTIENAMGYYNVQIIILMITTMNNTFIAIEKSKGNTFKLVILNLGVIFITTVLLLVILFLVYALYNYNNKRNSDLLQLKLQLQKEQNLAEYNTALISQDTARRTLIHDIRNHLLSISILNQQKRYTEPTLKRI